MRYTTPLRYPGGKSALANFVKLIFENNGLSDGHYVEPYAGGAGIAFSLLFHEYARKIHINDLDRSVFSFWHSILNETERFSSFIMDVPLTIDEWLRQREIQRHPSRHNLFELGTSFFYLNRTNRSGIVGGGVIGGLDQSGRWKIDARFNRKELIERVQRISRYSSRIYLTNLDAVEFISNLSPALPTNSLIYLDPPYYVKGRGLYESHYQPEDHSDVAKFVKEKLAHRWIVSYDNVPTIQELYRGFTKIEYSLNYSASESHVGSEVMFFCDSLNVPEVENPAKVKVA